MDGVVKSAPVSFHEQYGPGLEEAVLSHVDNVRKTVPTEMIVDTSTLPTNPDHMDIVTVLEEYVRGMWNEEDGKVEALPHGSVCLAILEEGLKCFPIEWIHNMVVFNWYLDFLGTKEGEVPVFRQNTLQLQAVQFVLYHSCVKDHTYYLAGAEHRCPEHLRADVYPRLFQLAGYLQTRLNYVMDLDVLGLKPLPEHVLGVYLHALEGIYLTLLERHVQAGWVAPVVAEWKAARDHISYDGWGTQASRNFIANPAYAWFHAGGVFELFHTLIPESGESSFREVLGMPVGDLHEDTRQHLKEYRTQLRKEFLHVDLAPSSIPVVAFNINQLLHNVQGHLASLQRKLSIYNHLSLSERLKLKMVKARAKQDGYRVALGGVTAAALQRGNITSNQQARAYQRDIRRLQDKLDTYQQNAVGLELDFQPVSYLDTHNADEPYPSVEDALGMSFPSASDEGDVLMTVMQEDEEHAGDLEFDADARAQPNGLHANAMPLQGAGAPATPISAGAAAGPSTSAAGASSSGPHPRLPPMQIPVYNLSAEDAVWSVLTRYQFQVQVYATTVGWAQGDRRIPLVSQLITKLPTVLMDKAIVQWTLEEQAVLSVDAYLAWLRLNVKGRDDGDMAARLQLESWAYVKGVNCAGNKATFKRLISLCREVPVFHQQYRWVREGLSRGWAALHQHVFVSHPTADLPSRQNVNVTAEQMELVWAAVDAGDNILLDAERDRLDAASTRASAGAQVGSMGRGAFAGGAGRGGNSDRGGFHAQRGGRGQSNGGRGGFDAKRKRADSPGGDGRSGDQSGTKMQKGGHSSWVDMNQEQRNMHHSMKGVVFGEANASQVQELLRLHMCTFCFGCHTGSKGRNCYRNTRASTGGDGSRGGRGGGHGGPGGSGGSAGASGSGGSAGASGSGGWGRGSGSNFHGGNHNSGRGGHYNGGGHRGGFGGGRGRGGHNNHGGGDGGGRGGRGNKSVQFQFPPPPPT
jgi:hypothetical protein